MLREGGNAVDAAVGAVLTSWVAEPLLTGPGAGGYLLVAGAGEEPTLLDFFVEAPGRGADPRGARRPAARRGLLRRRRPGLQRRRRRRAARPARPPGWPRRIERWGSLPAADLAAPAAALARAGVALNEEQAYIFEILEPILVTTPEARAVFAPEGRALRAGEPFRDPELADTIERFGAEGAEPFYRGDIGAAIVDWVGAPRRPGHAGRPRRLRRDPARAGARRLPRPRPCSPTRRRRRAARCSRWPWRGSTRASAGPPAIDRHRRVMEDVQAQRTAGVRRRAAPSPASPTASWPRGWARRPTSRSSTATGARAA